MRVVQQDRGVAERPRSRRRFWLQVVAAAGLLVIAAIQASTLHGYMSWFAVLALALAVIAAVLCAICAALTWRDLHSDTDEADRR